MKNGLPDVDTIRKSDRSPSPKKEEEKENKNSNSLDISKISKEPADASNNTSKTEIKMNTSTTNKIKEDSITKGGEKETKEIKEMRESVANKLKKEKDFILNLLLYLRENDNLSNDPV
jgi:hypothetical protein